MGNQFVAEDAIKQAIAEIDNDGDGQIDYHEFINMMKNSIGLEIRPDPLVDGQAQWVWWDNSNREEREAVL